MLTRLSRFRRAFTLVEMSIAAACVVIAGGTAFVFLQSATTLFLSGHAANRSNQLAYLTMDRLARDVHSSIEIPALVDADGTTITLTGAPVDAAGIRFRIYAGGPFQIPTATAASSATVTVKTQASPQMPRVGQLLAIPAVPVSGIPQDLFARVAAVDPPAATIAVTLTGALGSFTNPTVASGALVPANAMAHVVNDVAYIVVPSASTGIPELRFYPRAMSVAGDGAGVFNDPANFSIVTVNMAASPQPFSMAIGDRGIAVNLTVQDTQHSNRVKSTFMKNFTIGSTASPVRIYPRSIGL